MKHHILVRIEILRDRFFHGRLEVPFESLPYLLPAAEAIMFRYGAYPGERIAFPFEILPGSKGFDEYVMAGILRLFPVLQEVNADSQYFLMVSIVESIPPVGAFAQILESGHFFLFPGPFAVLRTLGCWTEKYSGL